MNLYFFVVSIVSVEYVYGFVVNIDGFDWLYKKLEELENGKT